MKVQPFQIRKNYKKKLSSQSSQDQKCKSSFILNEYKKTTIITVKPQFVYKMSENVDMI